MPEETRCVARAAIVAGRMGEFTGKWDDGVSYPVGRALARRSEDVGLKPDLQRSVIGGLAGCLR